MKAFTSIFLTWVIMIHSIAMASEETKPQSVTLITNDVYYIGEQKSNLMEVTVALDKLDLTRTNLGRIRVFGEAFAFSYKLDVPQNTFADGLLYDRHDIKAFRFYCQGAVLGMRTTGSKLEAKGAEKTVLFYCKEGFSGLRLREFLEMDPVDAKH